jgi:hypothetical protein
MGLKSLENNKNNIKTPGPEELKIQDRKLFDFYVECPK